MKVLAAGAVVTRRAAERGIEVLVIHRPRYDDWSLPKGKVDNSDRDLMATAVREINEETGLHCVLGPSLGATRYIDSEGRDKTVSYWLARPVGGVFSANDEVDVMEWLDPAAARNRLSRDDDLDIVNAAVAALERTAFVFLVRHARAGVRGSLGRHDDRRPLDDDGLRQAKALTALVAGGVTAIWSSPYVRCVQTVEPLAAAMAQPIVKQSFLAEGADAASALKKLVGATDGTVACTHGDVVEGILDVLEERRVRLPDHRKLAKGSTWVLTINDERVEAGDYLPPP